MSTHAGEVAARAVPVVRYPCDCVGIPVGDEVVEGRGCCQAALVLEACDGEGGLTFTMRTLRRRKTDIGPYRLERHEWEALQRRVVAALCDSAALQRMAQALRHALDR
jgi:hypothetical protein